MAVPACFHLADDVFPRVRSHAARRLVAQGWSQTRIAEALHVSQAMVSKYVARDDAEDDGLVLRLADDLVDDLVGDRPSQGSGPWCATLNAQQGRPGAEAALDDLLSAERRLLAARPLDVMPQVGLNIARAVPGAVGPDDVLAYPARIVAAGDQIVRPMPPAFGASRHLSACLMALRERNPSLHAIANIRGGEAVRKASRVRIELDGDGDREALFVQAVAAAKRPPTMVHDPGALGIEPCLYIAGPTATDVVDQILSIQRSVNP